jgi:hypothetical protein
MKALLAALALLGASAGAADLGMVWRVTGPHGAFHLAGSVHLLPGAASALPPAYERAYAASRRLVLEVDLGRIDQEALRAQLATFADLPAGRRLPDLLSADGARRYAAACAAHSLPCEALARVEPWSAAMSLLALGAARAGYAGALGVDQQLAARAGRDARPVAGLETVADQLRALDGLSPALQERLLLETVEELPQLSAQLAALVDGWRRGDLAAVAAAAQAMGEEPELAAALFAERHARWLPQLEALAAGGPATLVVVGAAHLVGPASLLDALAARGYRVERVGATP